jgi:hypothetical protein
LRSSVIDRIAASAHGKSFVPMLRLSCAVPPMAMRMLENRTDCMPTMAVLPPVARAAGFTGDRDGLSPEMRVNSVVSAGA